VELKDFIAGTLRDILTGIKEARESKDIGEFVAPDSMAKIQFPPDSGVFKSPSSVATVVKFDVAVTAESEKSGKGEGKIKVFGIGSADVGAQVSSKDTTLSRIQFSVPVVLVFIRI
jgi:hypothetical protein